MTVRLREPTLLGRRVLQLRSRLYLTQSGLAEKAALSRHIVQSIEQGRRSDPHLSTLLRLARAPEVPLADLVGDYEPVSVAGSGAHH